MMLRQEAALDRSIDRKVRILLRLRKESTNPPPAPPDLDDGPTVGDMEEIVDSDIASQNSQSAVVLQDSKMKERCGNVIENKGSRLDNREASGNAIENKCSYANNAGILLKRKGIIGNAELHATSKWPSFARKPGAGERDSSLRSAALSRAIEPRNATDLPSDARGKSLLFSLVNDEGYRPSLLIVQGEIYN